MTEEKNGVAILWTNMYALPQVFYKLFTFIWILHTKRFLYYFFILQ